jgi:hypothetical protein
MVFHNGGELRRAERLHRAEIRAVLDERPRFESGNAEGQLKLEVFF